MTSPNTNSENAAASRRRTFSRRILFPFFAVLVGLLPFAILEITLRVFNVGNPADSADPLAGFNRGAPLFERHGDVYRTTLARTGFFNPQEFPATKPPNGFRIFCFGGSTVFGHPYEAATSFSKWLELELNATDPTHAYQAINCGGISYASYRLALLVKEVLHYQPDLIIIATGHNEFLEDRTYQSIKQRSSAWASLQNFAYRLRSVTLLRRWTLGSSADAGKITNVNANHLTPEVRARLDSASGYASYHRDDAWRENVIAQYDESVRQMIADCRAAGVPVMLVKLGSNLRDCPPFKSEHRAGLTPAEEREWQKEFDIASSLAETNSDAAMEHYAKAAAIDDEYALLSYRMAKLADERGDFTDALSFYCRSRDDDICPLRIIKPMEDSLARVAVQTGTPLLDAASLLSADSPDFIPGYETYLDHVHPNIGGHQKIARALAAQMRECGFAPKSANLPEEKRRELYANHLQQLGTRYFAEGKERVNWLENWARRKRLADEVSPRDALGFIRLGLRQLDLADEQAAWHSFDKALTRDANTLTLLEKRKKELLAQGHSDYANDLAKYISNAAEKLTQPAAGGN